MAIFDQVGKKNPDDPIYPQTTSPYFWNNLNICQITIESCEGLPSFVWKLFKKLSQKSRKFAIFWTKKVRFS